MKKVLKVIWGIFVVIGILLTSRLIPVFCGNQSISIYRSTKGHYSDYVELIREAFFIYPVVDLEKVNDVELNGEWLDFVRSMVQGDGEP